MRVLLFHLSIVNNADAKQRKNSFLERAITVTKAGSGKSPVFYVCGKKLNPISLQSMRALLFFSVVSECAWAKQCKNSFRQQAIAVAKFRPSISIIDACITLFLKCRK